MIPQDQISPGLPVVYHREKDDIDATLTGEWTPKSIRVAFINPTGRECTGWTLHENVDPLGT